MDSRFIPAGILRLWNLWNIRGFMIMSLSVQLVLALASPLRQKTSNFIIISIIWSAYFLADWTAIFAFGLISNAGCSKSPSHVEFSEDLLALWASFLLIHLGGPDTITAFSLEDNALWIRHLVGLIAQVFAFFYIFMKTLPDNKLIGPIVLIFATGVIKYGKRTRALYLASFENFKESTVNQVDSLDLGCVPMEEQEKRARLSHFFHILKGLIVDVMPTHSQRLESRDFFLLQDAQPAYGLMATDLNMLYENLYTKIMAARSFWGVLIRNLAFYLYVAALVLFCIDKKDGIHTTDVWITYSLLAGVIALDSASEMMLVSSIWRDDRYFIWQICGRCIFPYLFSFLLYISTIIFLYASNCGRVLERSWSVKIGSFSLLDYSFEESRPRRGFVSGQCYHAFFGWIAQKTGIAETIAKMRYTSKIDMDEGIWEDMFGTLQERASAADEPDQVKEIYEARGGLTLGKRSDELKRYVKDFEYDQTVLFWHIATGICYNTDPNLDKTNKYVKFSKTLSDYMVYLLVKQPDMTSAVAGIFHKRYRSTCSELKGLEERVKSETLEDFSSKVMEEYGHVLEPGDSNGDPGRSVLIESCRLVMLLESSDRKWELICGVWVELLSYAAGHCQAISHARLISQGGEFVTFVWLAMAHLGIGPHFPKN